MLSKSVELSTAEDVIQLCTTKLALAQPCLSPSSIEDLYHEQLEERVFKSLLDVSLQHLLLARTRNQLLHLFLQDALVALCLEDEIYYGIFTSLIVYLRLLFVLSFVCYFPSLHPVSLHY